MRDDFAIGLHREDPAARHDDTAGAQHRDILRAGQPAEQQCLRTRADPAHLALEDVQHLGQFIEPVAAAIEASVQSESFAGGRSLVLGAGKLGLLVAQVLAARGDDVQVVSRTSIAQMKANRPA